MSDNDDLTQTTEGDSDLVKRLRAEIAARNEQLTEQGAKIQEQDSRLSELEQEKQQATKADLFSKLGIKVDEGPGKLLYDSYNGELDEENVRSQAEAYGILSEPKPETETEEVEAHKVINRAAAGAPASPSTAETPKEVMRETVDKVYRETGSRENAMAAAFEAGLKKAVEQRKSA